MPGQPRCPDLEQRLLAAASGHPHRGELSALTLAQVATRARAHRSDVYRRWPTKVRLVADTLEARLPSVSEVETAFRAMGPALRRRAEVVAGDADGPLVILEAGMRAPAACWTTPSES